MFNNQSLEQYIKAADGHKADESKKVLPLYKYGFIIKREHFKNLQIHTGYQNTIKRFIENRDSITKKELLCILKYYNISNIPDLPDLIVPDKLRITFVPQPQVQLVGATQLIQITYCPKPQIEIEIATIPTQVVYVPEAEVIVLAPMTITFTPQPEVILLEGTLMLTFVPQAEVEFDQRTVIPDGLDMTYVPEAEVGPSEPTGIVMHFVPPAQIEIVPSTGAGDVVYWGVIEGYPDGNIGRNNLVAAFNFNMAGLNNFTLSGEVGNILTLQFSQILGYVVFAIPMTADLRRSYTEPIGLSGSIGGPPGDFGNFWPDPEENILNNLISPSRDYRVYVSSFRSQPAPGFWDISNNTL